MQFLQVRYTTIKTTLNFKRNAINVKSDQMCFWTNTSANQLLRLIRKTSIVGKNRSSNLRIRWSNSTLEFAAVYVRVGFQKELNTPVGLLACRLVSIESCFFLWTLTGDVQRLEMLRIPWNGNQFRKDERSIQENGCKAKSTTSKLWDNV